MSKWNTVSDLETPAIRGEWLESDFLSLIHEFLEGYFDGAEHEVNGQAVVFPECKLDIQQSRRPPQPLNGNVIAGTWTQGRQPRSYGIDRSTREFVVPFTLSLWMRSSGQNTGKGGPHVAVRELDSIVYSLFNDKRRTMPLARKGVRHLRCQSPALVTTSTEPMRSVVVTGNIHYQIDVSAKETNSIVTEDGDVIMFGESPWQMA